MSVEQRNTLAPVKGHRGALIAHEHSTSSKPNSNKPAIPAAVPPEHEITAMIKDLSIEPNYDQERSAQAKAAQVKHLDMHRTKKESLRRSHILREADAAQDQDPVTVNPFNALPEFDCLSIAEQLDTKATTGEEVRAAAATILHRTRDGMQSLSIQVASPTYPRIERLPIGPQDNLLCIAANCPIPGSHYEGPYYHDNILGDQTHPYFCGSNPPPRVWDMYERSLNGCAMWDDAEMLSGFWAFHCPPFWGFETSTLLRHGDDR